MNTKQPEALTLAQKLENAPAWESQSPTIYGWNDSGETLADAAAELRRLHSDYETLRCKQQTLEELCADVQLLRLGYAAARQEIANLRVQPYDQQAMGLCHACGWKGVIDYPDGPVCVACEHDKTLSPQPAAQPLHVAATSCPHEIDKDKIVLHFDSKQPGKNALAQLAARLQAAQAQEDVPDMFWDADDTENFAHEIQDIVDGYGPGEIVTIECAKRMPNLKVLVTRNGDGVSYEHSAAQQGELT